MFSYQWWTNPRDRYFSDVFYSQLMLRCHSEVRSACWTRGLLAEHLNILPRWFMLGVKWRMLWVRLPSTEELSWLPSEYLTFRFHKQNWNVSTNILFWKIFVHFQSWIQIRLQTKDSLRKFSKAVCLSDLQPDSSNSTDYDCWLLTQSDVVNPPGDVGWRAAAPTVADHVHPAADHQDQAADVLNHHGCWRDWKYKTFF